MKARIWTPEAVGKLVTAINAGLTAREIMHLIPQTTLSGLRTKVWELKLRFKNANKKWTKQEVLTLRQLNDKGLHRSEIATILGVSKHAVDKKCSDLGIKSTLQQEPWTDIELEQLKSLFVAGKKLRDIAILLERSTSSVYVEAKKMHLYSRHANLIEQQKALALEGKKQCRRCDAILANTSEYFTSASYCRECTKRSRKQHHDWERENISLERLVELRLGSARRRANRKKIPFQLTEGDVLDIFKKQNGKCFYSGLVMGLKIRTHDTNAHSLSIDRISSQGGYKFDNIVLCCDAVNSMKMALPAETFLWLCRQIANHSTDMDIEYSI